MIHAPSIRFRIDCAENLNLGERAPPKRLACSGREFADDQLLPKSHQQRIMVP